MLILLLALQVATAQASPPAATAAPQPGVQAAGRAVQEACAADTRTHCADVQPGGGRILQCFREKYRQLSPLCKVALADLRRASQPR